MANWYGITRTNYFRVNDEEKYQALFNRLQSNEPIHDFTRVDNGKIWHGFGSYDDIYFLREDETHSDDFDKFLKEISKLLTLDSVFVITCIGNEKLRYLTGYCNVVFPNGKIVSDDLSLFAHKTVKDYFGQDYELHLDY